jgi:hypothetical protein
MIILRPSYHQSKLPIYIQNAIFPNFPTRKTESVRQKKKKALLSGSSNHLINPGSSINWLAFETSILSFTRISPEFNRKENELSRSDLSH